MDRSIAASIAAILALATCRASHAAEAVVYRCSDADGAVSLQDAPCPPDQAQQRRVFRTPGTGEASRDPPAASMPSPAPSAATQPAPTRAARAPQPLYECLRHDGSVYESTTGIAERRWVPLWVAGLDPRAPPQRFGTVGRTPPPPPRSGPGLTTATPDPGRAYGAGVWVEDRCRRLSASETCARHRDRIAGLGRRIHNSGQQSERERLRAEQQGLRARHREECAG